MPRVSKQQPTEPTGPRLVKKSAPKPAVPPDVTYEQIATRAYQLYEQEGYINGNHVDHWLRAERELREVVPVSPAKRVAGTRTRN